jgi:hypothetical protein
MEQPVYTSPESETALKEHLKERMNAAISIRRIAGGVNA